MPRFPEHPTNHRQHMAKKMLLPWIIADSGNHDIASSPDTVNAEHGHQSGIATNSDRSNLPTTHSDTDSTELQLKISDLPAVLSMPLAPTSASASDSTINRPSNHDGKIPQTLQHLLLCLCHPHPIAVSPHTPAVPSTLMPTTHAIWVLGIRFHCLALLQQISHRTEKHRAALNQSTSVTLRQDFLRRRKMSQCQPQPRTSKLFGTAQILMIGTLNFERRLTVFITGLCGILYG